MKELLKDYSDPPVLPLYAIGDTGPAGGKIFYDKGVYSDGWRYLEAAPMNMFGTRWATSSSWLETNLLGATSTAIGSGVANTAAILGSDSTAPAAYACDNLPLNGYTDWFLPSKDELNLMYINRSVIGSFDTGEYWSSSEYSSSSAWGQNVSTGSPGIYAKTTTLWVRAVRAF